MHKQIKERGIIFNAEMVRAILDGRKTQTRRVLKAQPHAGVRSSAFVKSGFEDGHGKEIKCPFGQVGDRLYVRETYAEVFECDVPHGRFMGPIGKMGSPSSPDWDSRCVYKADGDMPPVQFNRVGKYEPIGWTPSIHMPRRASRITLEITDIRVERLNNMCENDARSEGCEGGHDSIPGYHYSATPHEHFHHLWISIYGEDSWQSNPFVWVIEFKRVEVA